MRQQRASLPFRLSVHLLSVCRAAAHRVRCLRWVGKPSRRGAALCRQLAGCSAARALRPAQGARLLGPRPPLLRRQPAASPLAPLGSSPATRCPRPQVCLAPQLVPLNITLRDNYGAALRSEVGMAPLSSVAFSVVPATGSDIAVANASWSGAALAAAQPTGFVMRLLLPEPGLFLVSITVDGSPIPTSPFYLHVELLVCPSPLLASPDGLCLCPYGQQPGPGGCAAGGRAPFLFLGAPVTALRSPPPDGTGVRAGNGSVLSPAAPFVRRSSVCIAPAVASGSRDDTATIAGATVCYECMKVFGAPLLAACSAAARCAVLLHQAPPPPHVAGRRWRRPTPVSHCADHHATTVLARTLGAWAVERFLTLGGTGSRRGSWPGFVTPPSLPLRLRASGVPRRRGPLRCHSSSSATCSTWRRPTSP